MTPPTIVLALRMGSAGVCFDVPELAQALGLDAGMLRRSLVALLADSSRPAEGKPTEGEERYVSFHTFTSIVDRRPSTDQRSSIKQGYSRTVTFPEGGGPGEGGPRIESARLAELLAEALDDWGALAFLERLATEQPRELLLRGLEIALSTPPERIRRSRAAYFTGVVRRLARARAARAGTTPQTAPHA